jgi:methyltransferase-like protein 6
MYASKPRLVEQALADVLEERAGRYWTEFYSLHANKFYKDRHWFEHEFGGHLVGKSTFLEAGCGTGSTIYPLLDITGPKSHVYACDFASTAVDLVRRHEQFSPQRVTAFEADLTQSDALLGHVPPASVDAALMVFVLSAISPRKMRHALENVRHALKDDVGVVCFRDYAQGDLCESRMRGEGRQRLLEDGFYVRGDVGIGFR